MTARKTAAERSTKPRGHAWRRTVPGRDAPRKPPSQSDRPLSARVLVLDGQGVEIASATGIERATAASRALPRAVCIVGLDAQGHATVLAKCVQGASIPSELQCSAAVRRWSERGLRGAA